MLGKVWLLLDNQNCLSTFPGHIRTPSIDLIEQQLCPENSQNHGKLSAVTTIESSQRALNVAEILPKRQW